MTFMKMSKNHKSWQNVEIWYCKEMVVTFLFVKIQKYSLHLWIQYRSGFENHILERLWHYWLLSCRALKEVTF